MGNCFSHVPKPTNKVSPVLRPVTASSSTKKPGKFSFRFGFGRKQNKPAVKKSSTLFVPQLAIEKLQQYNKQRQSNSVESLVSNCCTPWPRSDYSSHGDVFSSSLQSVLGGVLTESTVEQTSSRSLQSRQSLELSVDDILDSSMDSKTRLTSELICEEPKQDAKAWQAEVDKILLGDADSAADVLLNELSELDTRPVAPVTKRSELDGPQGRRPKTRRGPGVKPQAINAAEKSKKNNKAVRYNDVALQALCNEIERTFVVEETSQAVYNVAEVNMMDEIEKEFGASEN